MYDKKIRNKVLLLIVFIVILVVFDMIFYSKFVYNERSYYTESYLEGSEKYELDGNVVIEQTFIANKNNLEAVAIGFDKAFRTYSNDEIKIQIIQVDNNQVIAEYDSIYETPVQDYKKYKFEFEKQPDSEGKEYKIKIIYENGSKGNPVLYQSQGNFEQGTLTLNGEEQSGNLNFELYYFSRYATTIFTIAMLGFNIVTILILGLFIFKKISINKTFLIVTIMLGLFYVFAIPIYRGHDEHAHFYRAYEISQGIFNTKTENEESVSEIPKAFEETTPEGEACNMTYYRDVIDFLDVDINEDETMKVNASYMAVYSPIPYIPQALTIGILNIFTDNVAIIFYGARIVNLLVSVFLLYFAMKLIPFGKKLIFLITILPTTMVQISSLSPDALTLTSSILFVAYVLKLWHEKRKITKKEVSKLTILGIVVALCKIVYIPFVFLVLILPKKNYKNRKSYILSIITMIVIPILINLIWLAIANTHLSLIDNNKSSVQTANILTNIPEYIRTAAYTLQYSMDKTLTALFGGGYITHNTNAVGNGFITVIPMILLFVFEILFDEKLKINLEMKAKVIISIISLAIIGLIFTSLYVQWSPLKWFFVDGIQGRYFLQLLLPLTILLAQNNLVKQKGNINLKSIITYTGIILNMVILMEIVLKYI